ncbi:hypothetical protein Droror1_Dr00008150 [Drosera rotundifolia]
MPAVADSSPLLTTTTATTPRNTHHLAYIIHFTLGAGFLLPWNAFITAVDYFTYLYPSLNVDRVFSVTYMLVGLVSLLLIILFSHKSNPFVRINVGLGLFVVALTVVPVMDVVYVKGETGVYGGFYVTVGAVAVCGLADALVQGGLMGAAGELPERYMQAVVARTGASGNWVQVAAKMGSRNNKQCQGHYKTLKEQSGPYPFDMSQAKLKHIAKGLVEEGAVAADDVDPELLMP